MCKLINKYGFVPTSRQLLVDNPKAHPLARWRRVKIWGEARVVEGDDELTTKLMPEGYKARPEQVILFTVSTWDANCPQHIPQRFEAVDVAAALAERDKRIEVLEAEDKAHAGCHGRGLDFKDGSCFHWLDATPGLASEELRLLPFRAVSPFTEKGNIVGSNLTNPSDDCR